MALIETNFIRPQEVYDRNTGESKVRYRSYDGNDRFIPVVEGENGVPKTLVEVTHAELKAMRDAGKLTPGALYRITDYQCTTTQENTQSAGHQFDIVLLALSKDKLAEEGWAMMHDTPIYNVSFNGGERRKCYYYPIDDVNCNFVDCNTLLGTNAFISDITFDEEDKTADLIDGESETDPDYYLSDEGLTYNYFQNSNLSAWKVWYCLDNDKSRFAWADDSVDISLIEVYIGGGADNVMCMRDSSIDVEESSIAYFGWSNTNAGMTYYTTTEEPSTTDKLYGVDKGGGIVEMQETIVSYYEGTGLPNGRGVIYRLIDEWGNDVPYDFKNILYLRKVTNGDIDAQGTDTYIPTFCLYDIGNDEYKDASIFAIEYPDDKGKTRPCNNIFIGSILTIDRSIDSGIYALPQNIILAKVEKDDTGWGSRDVTLVNVSMCNLTNSTSHVIYLSSSNKTYVGDNNTIISQGKRVVWENIS